MNEWMQVNKECKKLSQNGVVWVIRLQEIFVLLIFSGLLHLFSHVLLLIPEKVSS